MDKKEVVGAYSEDDVDRALADVAMWCNLHMGEFLDDGRFEFEALCGDEVSFDGMEGVAKMLFGIAFTEWITFDSNVFGHGCINEYLSRAEWISEQNRAIVSELRDTERFGFFRYEGYFDYGNGDMGIFASDTVDGESFEVYSTYLHDLAIERSYKLGTGLSARVATIGGRAYYVGQFPTHDKAVVEEGETVNLYRDCREFGFPFIVMIAACTLSPNGMFTNSAFFNMAGSVA